MSHWGRADGPSGRLAPRAGRQAPHPRQTAMLPSFLACLVTSPVAQQLPSPQAGLVDCAPRRVQLGHPDGASVPFPSLGFTLPARLSHRGRPSLLAIHGGTSHGEPPCRAARPHHSSRRGASCALWGVWRPLNALEARSAALPIVTTHSVPRHGHCCLGQGMVAESPRGESHCSRSSASEMVDGGDSLLRPVTLFLALPGRGGCWDQARVHTQPWTPGRRHRTRRPSTLAAATPV